MSAIVDVEALRYDRANAYFGNWLKDLRVEVYRTIYQEPIDPKNLWMDQPSQARPIRDQHLHESIRRLQERGVYMEPANGRRRSDLGVDVPGTAPTLTDDHQDAKKQGEPPRHEGKLTG